MDALYNGYAVMISLWQAGWYSTGISNFERVLATLAFLSRGTK